MSPSHDLVPVSAENFDRIFSLVIHSVRSPESQRAYQHALVEFLAWYQAAGHKSFTKAVVQEFRAHLEESGLAPSSVNLKLTAVRRLAAEAADNGLLAPEVAAGIARVKGVHGSGIRTGHWLNRAQTEELLALPDLTTNKGKRDRMILALLIGCGLRRKELVQLNLEQIQQRDGRWIIADLVGKGRRRRTVPMPSWAKVVVDAWVAASGVAAGPILRAVNKSDRILEKGISPQSVFNLVKGFGVDLGIPITPHDLRRTFAKLAHVGHAALEQIQLSLGHASVLTTERYLGVRQDLTDALCDHLGLTVNTA